MAKAPLRIGLLGAGAMGGEHAYCYSQMPDVRVAKVFSRRREAAAGAAAMLGAEAVADADAVIGDASLDAIDVCLPTPVHAGFRPASMCSARRRSRCRSPRASACATPHGEQAGCGRSAS